MSVYNIKEKKLQILVIKSLYSKNFYDNYKKIMRKERKTYRG